MLGKRLAWAREQQQLKQYWVADEAGLDRARYNRIEQGKAKRIFLEEVLCICAVVGCSLPWLAYGGRLEPWLPGRAPNHR